jgi:hypothetical protein
MIPISGFLLATKAYVICPQKFKVSHTNGPKISKIKILVIFEIIKKKLFIGTRNDLVTL